MTRWYDEKNNLTLIYFPLPAGVDEAVTVNPDGSYTAFIDCTLCDARKREAYEHALRHIRRGDFADGVNVQEAEAAAHRGGDAGA